MANNSKDKISTICGGLVVLSTSIAAAYQIWPADVPKWLMIAAFIIGGASAGKGFQLIGKAPSGKTKSESVVAAGNK